MNFRLFHRLPVQPRLALGFLALFVAGVWVLALTARQLLLPPLLDMQADQQAAATTALATQLGDALQQRLARLDMAAQAIRVPLTGARSKLQPALQQLQAGLPEFSGGLVLAAMDGTTLMAQTPATPVHSGTQEGHHTYLLPVLKSGKHLVSAALSTIRPGSMLVALAVPVHDASGKVIGALAGLIDLGQPNFLWPLAQAGYGKTGSVFLVDSAQGVVLSATDPSRVLQTLSASTDMGAAIGRAMAPQPDLSAARNAPQAQWLISVKPVPMASWFAVVTLPRNEALAPIAAMQRTLLWYCGLVSVLVFALGWWLIRRGLAPVLAARQRAEAANLAKSRFLAAMSHDIRTPMGGVLSMAQLLLMPNLGESERRDYARTIFSSGQSLIAILNDILDLSRIESESFEPDNVVFSPAALLNETRNLFAIAARAKGLALDIEWNGPPQRRYGADAHRLRQMLNNLVSNAIKFTAHGYVRIEAREVHEDAQAGAVLEFTVQDTGVGIAPGDIDLLFKPFSQLGGSSTRKFGGSGLGLSIVRQLALKMGGDAGVSSQAGSNGARIWFRIRAPIVAHGVESRRTERAQQALPDTSGPASTLMGHVLVVEDNPMNCMVIQAMLRTVGVDFSVVHDGMAAVQIMEKLIHDPSEALPDLILMDLDLPVLSGYEATERIRQSEAQIGRARVPIIALTADAFEAARQQCMAVGMDGFLSKPTSMDDLVAMLTQWLPTMPTLPAPTAEGFQALDLQAFVDQVNELIPLLEQNRFYAINRFHALQDGVKGTVLEEPLDALSLPLNEMDFQRVRVQLRNLVATLQASPTSEFPYPS